MNYIRHQIVPIVSMIVIYFICECKNISFHHIEDYIDFQFNLITVSTIFAGFLYTNYSILIGLSDTKLVEKISATSIIEKRNVFILNGILDSFLSVVLGLLLIIIFAYSGNLDSFLFRALQIAEIVYVLFAVLFFLRSLIKMNDLVKAVFKKEEKIDAGTERKCKEILKRRS